MAEKLKVLIVMLNFEKYINVFQKLRFVLNKTVGIDSWNQKLEIYYFRVQMI